ncbi:MULTISPECIES: TetR/AcrR family transcriptional regulator [Bacillaceae]|uniref:TetR family transcriptional regulator n=1 Tax=Evansella alkalicola TaxID=745819 RepID=A0ABS6JQX2_9BACI|nr:MULTISPECIES: TetR/AcrR family transcriptional regulator [Bacillaceae]MBU9720935.1 TetR family transcriptional regulator [Bacillus alkalicola]
MLEKEKLIIEAAIKLFSIKGFDATSIQDIANECGIAKGSFYSYFKSKDTLLLETLKYYFNKIQSRVESVEELDLEPKEKFIRRLTYYFEGVFEHKEFIITQAYEQAIPLNKTIKRELYRRQQRTRELYRIGLLSLYGNKIEPYIWDLSIMMEGMFHAYIRIYLLDEKGLEVGKLSKYIVNRIDSVVEGLLQSGEEPILSIDDVNYINRLLGNAPEDERNKVFKLISEMKNVLSVREDREDYLVSLEVLEEELNREKPRQPVIQGMISNFKGVKEVDKYLNEIKPLLK